MIIEKEFFVPEVDVTVIDSVSEDAKSRPVGLQDFAYPPLARVPLYYGCVRIKNHFRGMRGRQMKRSFRLSTFKLFQPTSCP